MNIQGLITVGISALLLTQTASAEVFRQSGERTDRPVYVECLNDTIILNWHFETVIATQETPNNWMFTRSVRQFGDAADSYGNTWKFRGHFQSTEHVDLTTIDPSTGILLYTTNFHLLSKDVMIAGPHGLGNLQFITQWRIVWENGAPVFDLRKTTVSCLL